MKAPGLVEELSQFFLERHFFRLDTSGSVPLLSSPVQPERLWPPAIKHWLTKLAQSAPG